MFMVIRPVGFLMHTWEWATEAIFLIGKICLSTGTSFKMDCGKKEYRNWKGRHGQESDF